MRIAVVGIGGVGGYFGGRLAQAGVDVTLIARGAQLQAIRAEGLRIESIKGDFVISPAQATDDPAQVGTVDMVLVAVKSWQLAEAAQAMRPLLGAETGVVPLLNGVEAPAQLAAALGAEHVLAGLCRIFAFITGPGRIRHVGVEPWVFFGELDNRQSRRAEQLREAFEAAGVRATIPADIQAALWEKFLFGASTSGLGAVTRTPIDVLRSLPATRRLLEDAMREIIAVAHAHNIALREAAFTDAMTLLDSLPPNTTASMQRDIMDGRPSELEAQNGAVVRLGAQAGVATPVHSFIYHTLLPQEMAARGQF